MPEQPFIDPGFIDPGFFATYPGAEITVNVVASDELLVNVEASDDLTFSATLEDL